MFDIMFTAWDVKLLKPRRSKTCFILPLRNIVPGQSLKVCAKVRVVLFSAILFKWTEGVFSPFEHESANRNWGRGLCFISWVKPPGKQGENYLPTPNSFEWYLHIYISWIAQRPLTLSPSLSTRHYEPAAVIINPWVAVQYGSDRHAQLQARNAKLSCAATWAENTQWPIP